MLCMYYVYSLLNIYHINYKHKFKYDILKKIYSSLLGLWNVFHKILRTNVSKNAHYTYNLLNWK